MSHNTFGQLFRVTTWGESHGPAIGCVVDGCPPGIPLVEADLQTLLDKRRPGQSRHTTQRREPDAVRILSGVFPDDAGTQVTTGTPIALVIDNVDQRSKDYGDIKDKFRPGHADLTYWHKYGIRDYRGGGRASARETAMRVAAGGIARKVIADIAIRGALVQVGPHRIDRGNWDWAEVDRNPFFCPDATAAAQWADYLDGVREAYATGRGRFVTRATTRIEKVSARRQGIVVTELPYLIGPEKVIEKIKDAVSAKKLQGVTAVTDLTDRKHGLRLVIEIKNGFNPEAVLERLYKVTPLEESFSMNNVALVAGEPRTLGLKEMLQVWIDHRISVVRRRSEHRLAARRDRLHLVDGLLIAILDIDDVIQIIRSSEDASEARSRLMTAFDLSEIQADYILELRLRRLTKFSRLELENEKTQLLAEIAELEEILRSPDVLRGVVGDEMDAAAAEHGTPRRTILLAEAGAVTSAASTGATAGRGAAAPSLEIEDTPCYALLSATGLVARTSDDAPPAREGRRSAHDVLRSVVPASARADVGIVTSTGRLHRLSLLEVPAIAPTSEPPSLGGGSPVAELVTLDRDEQVVALVPITSDVPLAIGTAAGGVKRVKPEQAPSKDVWDVIGLQDGDAVIGAAPAPDDAELVFVADDGPLLHFSAAKVRAQGRAGGGVAGINLGAGRRAAFFGVVDSPEDAVVVTIAGSSTALPGTTPGSAKVTPFSEYPAKGRATGGVRAHRFLKGEDALIGAWVGAGPARATSGAGQAVALPEDHGRRDGSGTPLPTPVHGIG